MKSTLKASAGNSSKTQESKSVALLQPAGMKKTRFRIELLNTLTEAKTPLSAAKIETLLRERGVSKTGAFDRATLYRNLSSMVEKGLAQVTDFGTGAGFYSLKSKDRHEHYVFCVECEVAESISYCGVAPMVEEASLRGYAIMSHRLELVGLCSDCR